MKVSPDQARSRVAAIVSAIAWIVQNDDTEWLDAEGDDLIPPSRQPSLPTFSRGLMRRWSLTSEGNLPSGGDHKRGEPQDSPEGRPHRREKSLPRRGAAAARETAYGRARCAPLPRPARTRGGMDVPHMK